MRRRNRLIAHSLSVVLLASAIVGTGSAQALISTTQPELTLNHLIQTSPPLGSTSRLRDNEGSAYVADGDALWMASDNDDALFEFDRTTGVQRRVVAQSAFVNAPRFGVGGTAGQARTEDLEALAYDATADVIYAFSGSTGATPTAFRLTRDVNHQFQVESWQPLPSEWTGAGWRLADGLTYVANDSTIRTYDFETNTFGTPFAIPGLSKILGLDFDDVTGDLLAVNSSERLYRASMTTRTLLTGWNGISLTGFGLLDTRAVEVIGEQVLVTDGADSGVRPVTDPMSHAVFVFDVTGPSTSAPTASFTATPDTGTAPLTVNFTDTSTGGPTSWAWTFGDGATSTSPSPSHVYNPSVGPWPRTFTATLTATNAQGSSSTSHTITVDQPAPPTASFTATPDTGAAPLTVNFTDTSTGGPTSWAWTFGDGGTSTSPSPSHEYTAPGIYTATLTATNALGSTSTSQTITVTATVVFTPVADAQIDQANPDANFGSAPIFSVDGRPVRDGLLKFDVDVGANEITGVTLRVYCQDPSSAGGVFFGAAGTPSWDEGTVTWANAPPAGASYGSLGAVTAGTWYEVDLTQLVTANGIYSLRIKNSSTNGADYATKEGTAGFAPQLVVDVAESGEPTAPTASFTATPDTGTAPLTVNFTDTSTGGPTSWAWTFGDGATSTSPSPSHVYNPSVGPWPRTFTATLTATNAQGSSSTSHTITVDQPAPPTASFTATPDTGAAPLTVNFTDTSTGGPTSWAWTFGDGGTSTSPSPSHEYTAPGIYTATLTATNALGSTSTSHTITVNEAPTEFTVALDADTYVNTSRPTKNYGSSPTMKLKFSSSADYRSLIKFTLNGLSAAPSSVKLRLYVTDASSRGGDWYLVSNDWTENTVIWGNKPDISGDPVASVGDVTASSWVEIDLTSAITGNGTYSFEATSTSSNTTAFSTNQGTNPPQVVVVQ